MAGATAGASRQPRQRAGGCRGRRQQLAVAEKVWPAGPCCCGHQAPLLTGCVPRPLPACPGRMLVDLAATVPDGIVCFFVSYLYMDTIVSRWNDMGILQVGRGGCLGGFGDGGRGGWPGGPCGAARWLWSARVEGRRLHAEEAGNAMA